MRFPASYKLRRTTTIIVALTACLIGLVAGRRNISNLSPWVAILALLVGLILLIALRKMRLSLVIILLAFAVGYWRGNGAMTQLNKYHDLYKRPVVINGVADTDGIYASKGQVSFDMTQLRVKQPYNSGLIGKLKIEGLGAAAVYRGDTVEVTGKIFPQRGGRQGRISFAKIKVLHPTTAWYERIRLRFVAGMQNALPEPHASFALGLLVGQRNTLPDKISTQLSVVGLTHLIAVSGYNLTILIRSARRIFGKRSKYQSTLLSLLLIGSFLLFTGLSSSIVRAALVSTISLLAGYYGRSVRPLLLLLLAAVITALWNPLYLWSDIGWYLSFLAFFGVLILAPLITRRLYGGRTPHNLPALIIESVSAQVVTTPLILFIFGQISIIGLVANILLVPLVPIAMLLVLVAGLVGMLIAPFAGWFAWPARLLLMYMLEVVAILSQLPHALSRQSINVGIMIGMYALMVAVTVVMWRKTKNEHDILTDENEM